MIRKARAHWKERHATAMAPSPPIPERSMRHEAEKNCPVSKLLNAEITLNATLD